MTIDAQQLADRYAAVWNEADPAVRRTEIERLWRPEGEHFVTTKEARGYTALEERVSGAYDKNVRIAGHAFRAVRNAQNGAAVARAMAVFEKAGQAEMAQKLAMESRQQVVDLVATGAAKAKSGDYKAAVVLMQEAATKLPDNPQVVFNAALAILKCLDHDGWDERLGQQAIGYIAGVRRLDPVNPKLPALAGLHQQILKKYDKSPRVKKAG